MRKILKLLIITSSVTLGLTSCAGISRLNPDKLKIDKAYKFVGNIQYGELTAAANFERTEADMWKIVFSEPTALEGLEIKCNNGEVTSSLEDLQSGVLGENSVSHAVYKRIIDAFENAVNGEGQTISRKGTSSRNEIKISSKAGTPAVSYELILDKVSLKPIRLTFSPNETGANSETALSVEFSEVEVSPQGIVNNSGNNAGNAFTAQ